MSIEAIHWALNYAPIPADRRDASSLAVVLIGLANHADPDGNNAFPSLHTLTRYTRLSERSVRYALRTLEDLHLIAPSDPDIVAAYVKRPDRRPNGYNLTLTTTPVHNHPTPVDNPASGRQTLPPADQGEGQTPHSRGANNDPTRGNHCPRTVLNHPGNLPARDPAPPSRRSTTTTAATGRTPVPPPCGQCDARPGDHIAARLIWPDNSDIARRCPRCHPTELARTTKADFQGGTR
jgi:hypothetical protein